MGDDLSDESSASIPIEEDLRYITSDDPTSSDDSDKEDFNLNKPQKYNQLNPKAKFVHKLLKSVQSKAGSVWKTVEISNHNDFLFSTNSSYNLFSDSSNTMAKNMKRKREEMSSEEELSHHSLKSVKRNMIRVREKANHNAHSMSCSDRESWDESDSKMSANQDKLKNSKNNRRPKQNSDNSNQTSRGNNSLSEPKNEKISENSIQDMDEAFSENETVDSVQSGSKKGSSESEQEDSIKEPVQQIPPSSLQTVRPKSNKENGSHISENIYHKHNFTQADEEEISKFSVLLNDKLAEKNNIWILHCPSNMDVTKVVNQNLDLTGSCHLNTGQYVFEACSYRDPQLKPVMLAVPTESNNLHICSIPITGNIMVEDPVNLKNNTTDDILELHQQMELPNNLRQRHPHLGMDFENQPKTVARTSLKKKKKKHDKTMDGIDESELNSSEYVGLLKKKKKRHNEELEDSTVVEAEITSSENVEHSKKKKKKKKRHSQELSSSVVESELTSSDNFEHCEKKKRHREELNDSSVHEESMVKRKKKRHEDESFS